METQYMENRKSFTDFDAFLQQLFSAVAKAVPNAFKRQVLKLELDSLIHLERDALDLGLRSTTYHLVEDDEQVVWEETDEYSNTDSKFRALKSSGVDRATKTSLPCPQSLLTPPQLSRSSDSRSRIITRSSS
jgi:hypothetical protein